MKDIRGLSVYRKFVQCIETHHLLSKDTRVVLGVSGGADSVCMLLLFYAYLPGDQLVVAHLNHGIRGDEANADENYVRLLCKALDVRFVSESVSIPDLAKKVGKGIEETARTYRYEFLCRIANEENALVAVAHNQDDRAETILMNIARGCSVDGLKGISYQYGKVIRPILDLSRDEIESFCREQDIHYVTDSTNLEDCTLRNKIRHHGIPFLNELFAQDFSKKLIHLSESSRKDAAFIEQYTKKQFDKIVTHLYAENVCLVSRSLFAKEDEAIQYRIVRLVLSILQNENGNYIYPQGKDLTYEIIHRMVDHICNGQSGRVTEGGKNIQCLIEHDYARFYVTTCAQNESNPKLNLSIEYINLSYDEMESRMKGGNDWEAYFDSDAIEQLRAQYGSDITVRPVASGDCFVPFGSKGHVTVQKFLIDRKVPLSMRSNVNVVCIGNEILWIPGLRRSEIGRVTTNTKQIIKLTIKSEALYYGTNQ